MEEINLADWVEKEPDQRKKSLREAMHIVLESIATSRSLKYSMVMKGGVLLAIKYKSTRFTKDIDFSSAIKIEDFKEEDFLEELSDRLIQTSVKLDYGLECKIQSAKIEPSSQKKPTFPTFKIKIGYAYTGDIRSYKRLKKGQSSTVVKIDYSLNESTYDVDYLSLSDAGTIQVYNVYEIVAEKFRAILQQAQRKRNRRQDIYDLYCLFKNISFTEEEAATILKLLQLKSIDRKVSVSRDAISQKEIIERSEKEYGLLEAEIEEPLPDFKEAYSRIRDFYDSLPWEE